MIQQDGRIVVVGNAITFVNSVERHDSLAARYNTDGSLDHSFNGTGKIVTRYSGGDSDANLVALQQDGKIVVPGAGDNPDTQKRSVGILRLNTDGAFDPTFGVDGKVNTDPFGSAAARSVAVLSNGKILAAGLVSFPTEQDFAMAPFGLSKNPGKYRA